jgi:hypothetical protein
MGSFVDDCLCHVRSWWEEPILGLPIPSQVAESLAELHAVNESQWELEDRVREVKDCRIADLKRRIDEHNLRRNELIERIDERLAGLWPSQPDVAPLSESVGSSLDRLSVLEVRIANQPGANSSRGSALEQQRTDLIWALRRNCADLRDGLRRAPDHRRFKQYGSVASKRS